MKVVTPFTGQLDEGGFYARVELDDGTEVALVPLFGGTRTRLTVGRPSNWNTYGEAW